MGGYTRTSNLGEGMNDLLSFLISFQPKQAVHESRRDQNIARAKLLKRTKRPEGQLRIIAPKTNPNKKQPRDLTSGIAPYKIQKVVTRAIVVTRLKHPGNFINIHQGRSASLTSDTDRERTQACSAPSSHPRRPAIEINHSARAGCLTALNMALAVSNEVIVIPVGTRRSDQCNSHPRRWAIRIQNAVRTCPQHLTHLNGISEAIAVDLWTKIPVAVRIAEVAPIVRPNGTRGARDHGGAGAAKELPASHRGQSR